MVGRALGHKLKLEDLIYGYSGKTDAPKSPKQVFAAFTGHVGLPPPEILERARSG